MSRFFIYRPIFAISLAIIIVLLGTISIFNLSIEQYPDITPPVVEVSATYNGADAETVNNAVAIPLAQSVMGVSDMLYMQSTSANDGSMTLQVTFDIGTDPDMNAVLTQNSVSSAMSELPTAVTQQGVTTRKTQTGFLMVYALYSDGRYSDGFLSNYAYINIRNNLLKINGVGKVSIMGAGEYAMRIWLRPDVLHYYGLSVDDVVSAVASQSGIYPAGEFGAEPSPESTQYTYTVTMPPQISSPEEFSRIVVRTLSDGGQVLLSDVAEVELGSRNYGSSSLFNGKPTAVMVIYQEPGSNAVDVGNAVKAEMARLSGRFPDGISYASVVDSTDSIMAGIHDIMVTLVIALLLVIFIIYVFIQDWRATLIPLVAIPISLIGTFMAFPLLGFSINIISLLGMVLAVGLVVDDAIVVVEAVQVNIEKGMDPREATVEAMKKVSSPVIATSIVLLAVFIPVSFSGGITGRLFQQFAVTISVSVIFSTLNALTLSPALCAILLKPRKPATKGLFGAFNRQFDRFMIRYSLRTESLVRRTGLTSAVVVALLAAIALIWVRLPAGFLPEEDQGFVTVFVKTPDATSLPETQRVMSDVDALIKRMPEIDSSAAVAGFNMIAGVAATNCGIIFVKLVPFSDRRLSAMKIVDILNRELYTAEPAADCYAFVQPSIPGLGVTSGVTFEVQDLVGRGTEYLARNALSLMDSLKGNGAFASVSMQFDDGIPQRRLEIDRQQALIKGVPLSDLYSQTSALLGGRYVNNFNRFGQLYQTYVQAAPEYRQDARSFDSYFINASDGTSVPLSSFVKVRDTVGVGFVSQFNLLNSISLTADPSQGTSTAQAMKAVSEAAARLLPDDVGFSWSGVSFQEASESRKSFSVYLIAIVFVFLILSALYESWGLPVSILLSVPLAVAGSLLAIGIAHLFNPVFINDIYLQISLVMLIGLAAKNAILVVEYADKLFFEEKMSLFDAAVGAAKLRVRPILMTALAFILGILPLVFADGVYSTARNIMGVALLGGMTLATAAGIFLYPALYYLVAQFAGFENKRDKNDTK